MSFKHRRCFAGIGCRLTSTSFVNLMELLVWLGTVHLIFWGGGGGGGLGFMSGPEIFFRTISEQGYFFRHPFGPDYFFS